MRIAAGQRRDARSGMQVREQTGAIDEVDAMRCDASHQGAIEQMFACPAVFRGQRRRLPCMARRNMYQTQRLVQPEHGIAVHLSAFTPFRSAIYCLFMIGS